MAPAQLPFLTQQAGLIFRITHIRNIPWILDHGLHCSSSSTQDPHFKGIGNPELIQKRAHRVVPVQPGGTLGDYVPFYFTPCSPMLFNIKTGWGGMTTTPMPDIAIIVTSVRRVITNGLTLLIADRHAYLQAANFSPDPRALAGLDWSRLQAVDFRRRPDDPERFERYQAEALVYRRLPTDAIECLVCYGTRQLTQLREAVTERGLDLDLQVHPDWYF